MSWEEDYRNYYKCPCGKGKYVEIVYSDDWNRSDVRREMLCEECKKRYVWDNTVLYEHPGKCVVHRGWVLKEKYNKNKEVIE